ncbi:MAG: DUF6272 family protein [Bacteroidales bacterium]|jgi:hypothetical protein|nr:hypothetical protein [Bacteroidales bacterium]MDI9576489.1 DUF6272 family protein [Bacteroidota bacterium]MDD2593849.1 DUF6272 family protein [Bacteroidales bacterium]MDD3755654.1 DUF6272 family protein [Bacteroidales bacterium]MDY0401707.1 DUF6272 family protein [Bacteroidales bacterium]
MKALHFDINKYLDQYYATSEVLVSFKGMITESKIGRLLDELELNLKKNERQLRSSILLVASEMLDNVVKYTSDKILPQVFLAIRKLDTIQIITANTITPIQVDSLRNAVYDANRLSQGKVKEKVELNQAKEKNKKLGLMDVYHKTNNPIQINFYTINDGSIFAEVIATFKI